MIGILRNLFVIAFIIGVVFLAGTFSAPVRNKISSFFHIPEAKVLGTATKKDMGNVIPKIDVNSQVEGIKKQAINVKVGDAVGFLSTLQKTAHQVQVFINEKTKSFTKK